MQSLSIVCLIDSQLFPVSHYGHDLVPHLTVLLLVVNYRLVSCWSIYSSGFGSKKTGVTGAVFVSSSLGEICILWNSCHFPCAGYPPGAQQPAVSSQLSWHATCPR